jgi:F-BAR domain only protein
LTGPGLQASIIETVSVQFEDGEVKSAAISGEIAFVSNYSDDNMFKSKDPTASFRTL